MKTYYPKDLYKVRTNDRCNIIVKARQEELEKLVQEDAIIEYIALKVVKFPEVVKCL